MEELEMITNAFKKLFDTFGFSIISREGLRGSAEIHAKNETTYMVLYCEFRESELSVLTCPYNESSIADVSNRLRDINLLIETVDARDRIMSIFSYPELNMMENSREVYFKHVADIVFKYAHLLFK